MYAIIKTGGKQLKVAKGDTVVVEKLDAPAGEKVTLSDVLLLNDGSKVSVGTPLIAGASVTASVTEQGKGQKVRIFKRKRRQTYRRMRGHRQPQTMLKIEEINVTS